MYVWFSICYLGITLLSYWNHACRFWMPSQLVYAPESNDLSFSFRLVSTSCLHNLHLLLCVSRSFRIRPELRVASVCEVCLMGLRGKEWFLKISVHSAFAWVELENNLGSILDQKLCLLICVTQVVHVWVALHSLCSRSNPFDCFLFHSFCYHQVLLRLKLMNSLQLKILSPISNLLMWFDMVALPSFDVSSF